MPYKALFILNRCLLTVPLIAFVDTFLFNGTLKALLPNSVIEVSWYYLLFGLPHIIASFVAYCSKEYFIFYKKSLYKSFAISLACVGVFSLFPGEVFLSFFIAYTMYHVISQQIGLCRKYIGGNTLFPIWNISALATAVPMALSIGGEVALPIAADFASLLQGVALISLLIFTVTTVCVIRRYEYVATTALIIISAALLVFFGYPIIGIMLSRVLHDSTAFIIYTRHDSLLVHTKNTNYLYSLLHVSSAYVYVVLPLFGIVIAFLLQELVHPLTASIIIILSLMHYLLEATVWRRTSLHRKILV